MSIFTAEFLMGAALSFPQADVVYVLNQQGSTLVQYDPLSENRWSAEYRVVAPVAERTWNDSDVPAVVANIEQPVVNIPVVDTPATNTPIVTPVVATPVFNTPVFVDPIPNHPAVSDPVVNHPVINNPADPVVNNPGSGWPESESNTPEPGSAFLTGVALAIVSPFVARWHARRDIR